MVQANDDADRTNAVRQARFRARRRFDRGRAAHNRLHCPDVRALYGERITVALLRLGPEFCAQLSEAQVEAGETVARIYGEYARATGETRRHCASPHYERAFAGKTEIVWPDQKCARAQRRWQRLQVVLESLPSPEAARHAREAIETLCVDDEAIAAALIPDVAWMLDQIAREFGVTSRRPRRNASPGHSTSRRTPSRARERRAGSVVKEHWLGVEKQHHPDLTDTQLEAKWRAHHDARMKAMAYQDRATLRAAKAQQKQAEDDQRAISSRSPSSTYCSAAS